MLSTTLVHAVETTVAYVERALDCVGKLKKKRILKADETILLEKKKNVKAI